MNNNHYPLASALVLIGVFAIASYFGAGTGWAMATALGSVLWHYLVVVAMQPKSKSETAFAELVKAAKEIQTNKNEVKPR